MRLRPLALLLLTALAACGNKEGDAKPAAPSSAAAASASAPAPAARPVEPRVEALAKAALPCKGTLGFDSGCAGFKAWRDAQADFANGKGDASLVAMLADPDEWTRLLAASQLNRYGKVFPKDKALAADVLAAAEKEKSKLLDRELGEAVGRIAVRETGTMDRVKALVKAPSASEKLRSGVVSQLLMSNPDDEAVYDLVRDAVNDPDKTVAFWALHGFWMGGGGRPDATCQVFFDHLEDPDESVAGEAQSSLGWYHKGNCATRYDALLDVLEKRTKSGTGDATKAMWAAQHLCEDEKATAKQKKRAADVARAFAGAKGGPPAARADALGSVVACDPAGGKAFAAKFKSDPERFVSDKAAWILATK